MLKEGLGSEIFVAQIHKNTKHFIYSCGFWSLLWFFMKCVSVILSE